MDKSLLWLWLSLHFGANSKIYGDLISYFDDIEDVFRSTQMDMDLIGWLSTSDKRKILNKNLEHALEVREWCENNEVQIIAYSDDIYPSALRKIRKFPPILYCKGEFPDFDNEISVSAVGTRSMTSHGQRIAFDFGYTLSKGGAITVTGMARGIDSTVAIGTINAFGRTVAVLGSGIDIVYPRENYALMNKIIENGAVITEFPPHSPPNIYHFPIRNRIISGISNATLIVEAPLDSGALITARTAIEQGKPLFAVPGIAKFHSNNGTNALIKNEDAKMATSAEDVLKIFYPEHKDKINLIAASKRPAFSKSALKVASGGLDNDEFYSRSKENKKKISKGIRKFEEIIEDEPEVVLDPENYSSEQIKLFSVMERGVPVVMDDLVQKTGLSAAEIASNLTLLQIEGLIDEQPGGFFMKN
ncbi:MAG: DNA-processing protein DprA [Clostridia bacterium]|nr:DNA-processing protein DprA [Clostridia bacterium]